MTISLTACKPLIERYNDKMGMASTDLVAEDIQSILEAAIAAGVVRAPAEPGHITQSEADAYRDAARARYKGDDDVEFDEGAEVTEPSKDGAFVHAWIWVDREEARLCGDTSCGEIVGDAGDGYDGFCGNHADAREVAQ